MENDFDKYNMRQVIIEYPNDLELGKKFAKNIKLKKREYANLIICGMGGSALPADLLAGYLSNGKKAFSLPLYITRTYDLPNVASNDSLIFISSYSGTTEETLSCFKKALEIGATIVAFSAGGDVEEIAVKNGINHVKYSIKFPGFQPRYATTYAFAAMNEVLTKIGLSDTIEKLPDLDCRSLEVQGEELAKKTVGRIPIIYAPDSLKVLAKIWKIKINENAKTPAFWNYFPELNHNEMVGFTHLEGSFSAFILRDKDLHPQLKKRIDITTNLLQEYGVDVSLIDIRGKSYLEKMIWGMVMGDWVSYYLAYEYQQDPTPVEMVEKLKKMLR